MSVGVRGGAFDELSPERATVVAYGMIRNGGSIGWLEAQE
jgi:hypothetical protein